MSFLNIGQKLEKVMGKEQELLDAARTGNVPAIDKLLSNKPRKSTAVGGGFGHKLSSFLKCNVNCTDKGGFTPLHHAAVNGHRDVVEKLLKYEAQPGSVDNKGCSPVHLAAWNGNPEIVMQLLTAGTDAEPGGASPVTPVHVNQQNGNGDTALHSAAQYGHVAVVDVLLQKHANPTIRNLDEASPLDLAAQYGRLEVVQLLLIKHPELAHRPQGTQSPLHLASGNGHRDIVEVLLNNNFDLHTTTESGTSLHEAALHGKLDVVRILLDWGIDVSARDQKGLTVLELLSAHQTQHKSFTLITQAIKDHMAKLASNQSESATYDSMSSGLYDSLTNCRSGHGDKPTAAVKPMPPDKSLMSDKPVMKTLDKPTPAVQSSIIQLSPDHSLDEPTPMYAKPHKELTESDDRVVSSISSVGDLAPPPLPPRSSIFQDKPLAPHKVMETVSPDRSTTGTTAKVNMCVPKKPPRQKKSPAPVRRSSDSTAPDSPPVITSTPPTTKPANNIPDNTRSIPNVDIVISDNADCVTSSQHSFKYSPTSTDQLDTKGEELDLSAVSKSHSSNIGSPISPKPALPPRTNVPASKVDNSIDPQTGLQVHQDVYEVMKPVKQVEPIKPVEDLNKHTATDASLKPAEVKIDNYGILFPNFKNSSPEKSQKSKKHEFKRTNTAPEESVYVGHHPISPVSSFKDRQGKLTRANTAPEETSLYTSMTGSIEDIPQTKKEPMKENEYAEIAEKSPTSPKENIYATITDTKKELESQTSVYSQISDLTPPVSPDGRGDNSEVKLAESKTVGNDEEVTVVADESKTSHTEQDCNTKGSIKPNYLDFIKRKSTAPLTPTGYPQPPTPDFPPPSPATAMMGIELKIQEMDAKRKSRDITTITDDDDTLAIIEEQSQSSEVELKVKDTVEVETKGSGISSKNSDQLVYEGTNKVEVKLKQNEAKVSGDEEVDSDVNKTSDVSKVTTTTELSQTCISVNEPVGEESKNSVIQSQVTKGIPKSSIPNVSVIETKSDKMSENQSKNVKTVEKPAIPKRVVTKSPNDVDTKKSAETKSGDAKDKLPATTTSPKTVKTVEKPAIPKRVVTKSPNDVTKESAETESGDTKDKLPGATASPVMMRKKTSTVDPDLDQFKGLLRGSTIGAPRKVVSQFYDDVLRKNQAGNRKSVPSSVLTFDPPMEKEEEIDIDQVMKSIDREVANRASSHLSGHDSTTIDDDSEEWAKIQDIMASFGGGIARESVFIRDLEPGFTKLLAAGSQMMSIGEWLENLQMEQYENSFIANGYDNVDFLDSKILEEQDLEQIGVLNYDHRQKLLQGAEHLPQLTPIDKNCPPVSVEDWLMSLQLLDYLETFTSHGYDTMEKVESILWELQLRTVLDISMLGHRKRILASLGDRHPPDRQNTKQRSISSLSPEDPASRFGNIDLFKDYSNVKPVSSSEEDIKESTQMAVDSSEDEDVFKKGSSGQSIKNSNIHLRPPHLAQTSSPAKQWRHKPEMLIKGCCNYTAQYLGSTMVSNLTGGTQSTRAGITKLKKSTDVLAKVPIIMLSISFKGVKFIDAKSKKVICDHEIGNIFCACQDTDNLNFFAYITRDIETGHHYCHVFSVKSSSLAHDIILTLGESFEVAYQMAMKDKSMAEAMELDRKMSQSDAEDTYSVSSKISTNTV